MADFDLRSSCRNHQQRFQTGKFAAESDCWKWVENKRLMTRSDGFVNHLQRDFLSCALPRFWRLGSRRERLEQHLMLWWIRSNQKYHLIELLPAEFKCSNSLKILTFQANVEIEVIAIRISCNTSNLKTGVQTCIQITELFNLRFGQYSMKEEVVVYCRWTDRLV